MSTAIVNKVIPFSSVDGPGNRTAIFLQGCNFNCKYCHNPETIAACIHCGACVPFCKPQALKMENGKVTYDITKCVLCDECFHHCPHGSSPRTREMTAPQVMELVRRNMPFIRGITVSGGECTRWPDFLRELLTLARAEGLSTLLDSNGSYDFSADPRLMAVTDGVMLDVKAWSAQEHMAMTGQDNHMVLQNLRYLAGQRKLTEVRTVVVPGLYDCRGTVEQVSRLLSETHSTDTRYKIIRFRPMGVRETYKHLTEPTDAFLQELRKLAESFALENVITV
ncbi:MAG: YjjW family glycine radical enzyme activase [Firmicutes bacterium]|nr:YjjW family glycine radical enzyme activase [Bacillota bacterium]